jgi:16S rRNA (cytosine967-C5)-methyltransferase
MNPKPTSARAQALGLLTRIMVERLTLDEAIARAPLTGEQADQRFAMLLVRTVLQHVGQLDEVIARYVEKPLPAKRHAVTNALRLGVAQLLCLNTPAHAAVNETVMLVKKGKDAALAGLVNAVLQKIVRENPALPAPLANLPTWLRTRWEKQYGVEVVIQIAHTASLRAPLDVIAVADMQGAVRLDGQVQRLVGEHAPIEELAGYAEGAFYVQDVAASYPVRLLGDVRGLRVLDVCAAPGGKAVQLARSGAFVTALDRSAHRMARLRENMARLQCEVEVLVADALAWQPVELYDAILLDAPCTASGTWRRHSEVVHLLTPEDIAEMAALQRALLARAWQWLKPQGKMVYCVCSLEPEEGEQQAAWFMNQMKGATLIPLSDALDIPAACLTPEGYLRTRPDMLAEQGGMDGFFAFGMQKRNAF